jgi:PAS domain S-box-containing protein
MAANLSGYEALAASEARFRATFDNAAVGMGHLAVDGRWLEVNNQLRQITGYTRDELLARRVQDLWPAQNWAEDAVQRRRVLTGEVAVYKRHKRYIRKNGALVWVAVTASPVRQADGRADFFVATVEDISERKRAEEALRESEERMRVAARAASVGFWVLDLATQRVRATPEYFHLFGLAPTDEPVPVERIRALYLPEDRATIIPAMEHSMRTGRPLAQDRRIRTADGRLRWVHLVSDTRRDTTAQPVARYGATFDITERKESEEHIQLLMREISHRAKNLLTVIQVMARQTASEADPEVFAEHFGDRLAGLAASHDLLVKSDWHGVDTADLVRSQLAHFGHLVETRVILEGPSLKLRPAAAQALGMALRELATNAAKYGALSNAAGVIRIAWDIVGNDRDTRFRMRWSERGGPRPQQPAKRGFGHTVMVEMLKQALEAEVRLEYPSSGVVWELVVPIDGPHLTAASC